MIVEQSLLRGVGSTETKEGYEISAACFSSDIKK